MLGLAIVVAFVIGIFWAGPVGAEPPGLPRCTLKEVCVKIDAIEKKLAGALVGAAVEKTGQEASYATGDDGYWKKGVAWSVPRFTDNEDGTVTDNLTGLIWLQNASCGGKKNWDDAVSWCNGLQSGDCDLADGSVSGDWRLPNIKELQSLIDYGNWNPAVPSGHPFSDVEPNHYWSATTYANMPDGAWYVKLGYGSVDYGFKNNERYVWPVRGGQ